MTDLSAPRDASARRDTARLAMLAAGFAVALCARVAIGRPDVARSAVAGLVFAAALAAMSLSAGARRSSGPTRAWIGLPGAVVLCLPLLAGRAQGELGHLPAGRFLPWAAIVAVVAAAEEMFLRGALYDACVRVRGETLAIGAGAVLFALLHVPLYGWRAVPLDLAVGIWLGALRRLSGGWAAPAVAHVVADLAAWWLK